MIRVYLTCSVDDTQTFDFICQLRKEQGLDFGKSPWLDLPWVPRVGERISHNHNLFKIQSVTYTTDGEISLRVK